jgi:dienelactone hydrolase
MKEALATFALLIAFIAGFFVRGFFINQDKDNLQDVTPTPKVKPLNKYTIENMSKQEISPGKITIKGIISDTDEYTSYLFEFEFSPTMDDKNTKKTTGQINIPKTEGPFPAILMFRGYIDQKTFKTGDGTRNTSTYFAKNNYLTIAPDFLGYGGSDKEANNIFEARFQTYVTAITLLKTIEGLTSHPGLVRSDIDITPFNISSIFIWGHSNGGQIALTLLEESGAKYPTILWAPVSKPFPYSVLYYTDMSEDHGKLIREELAKFEVNYDVEKYSLANYLDKIQSPIQLNQGTADDAVPLSWSNNLNQNLKALGKDVAYITYPGTGHDMVPSWNEAVANGLNFYNSFLK